MTKRQGYFVFGVWGLGSVEFYQICSKLRSRVLGRRMVFDLGSLRNIAGPRGAKSKCMVESEFLETIVREYSV